MDAFIRSETVLRHVKTNGIIHQLGVLEAVYFDLLQQNRGKVIYNEWAFRVMWPGTDRLVLLESNRLNMIASSLNRKVANVIRSRHGVGRYIPPNSGIVASKAMRADPPHYTVNRRAHHPMEDYVRWAWELSTT